MALDYGNYLLSSSPPGFEFIRLKNFEFNRAINDFPRGRSKYLEVNGFKSDVNTVFHLNDPRKEHCIQVDSELGKTQLENIDLVDDRTKVPNWKEFEQIRIADWEHAYSCDPESCACGAEKLAEKTRHKNVTFADDLGRTLAEVHTMRGSSDVPPELTAEVLSQLGSCLSSGSAFIDSDDEVRLSLNFPQPAANYSAFREKLERNSVSLENVIAKDMRLFGTIKVRKGSRDERVFVRCTFDSWESYADHAGVANSNSNNSSYDTFSFRINVPSGLSPRNSVQFAVCFESESAQFWDNNDGKNYEVTHDHRGAKDRVSDDGFSRGAFALCRKESWSNYTGWSDEHSDPYW